MKADLVSVDNRFEKAVNLSLDIQNKKKIDNYIPTASSMRVLSAYIDNVTTTVDRRANILVGPYGRGKSHLLLVLLSILAKDDSDELKNLLERISKAFPEASEKISAVVNMGPFLPVIINPSEEPLNKTFYKGLMKSLHEYNLTDISPDSFYLEAERTIETWKNDFPNTYVDFCSEINSDVETYIEKLRGCDEETLSHFKSIYPRLTSGSTFNPLVEEDIVSVYKTVNRRLRNTKSFSGIYIVFDEFSKFVEGHSKSRFSADMKTLQDLCELALASNEEQLHVTFVAHKSISSYSRSIDLELINSFEGVSGRLSEIQFTFSTKNNYELIADAITKRDGFKKFVDNEDLFNYITSESYKIKAFSSLFTEHDFRNIVAEGCYPMTPVAAMLLLELCEKIAQNERTVFTYLCSSDRSSLSSAIKNSENSIYVDIDTVYDYFTPLFRKDLTYIHFEWLKSEFAISMCENKSEVTIVKALALIKMAAKEELAANELLLQMAAGMDKDSFSSSLNSLIDKDVIIYRRRLSTFDFKNNIGIDINSVIKDTIQKYFANSDVTESLSQINKQKYILPKRHNQNFCITRYFNVQFISTDALLALNELSYLKHKYYPDGYVLFVLGNNQELDIFNHIKFAGLNNLVVVLPEGEADISNRLKELLAVRKLRDTRSFTDDNPMLIKELINIEEELTEEVNEWIQENYFNSSRVIDNRGIYVDSSLGLNRIVSDICDQTYNKTLVINHELINRHAVTAQIAKARGAIIKLILADGNLLEYETGTSAESTIYRAVFCGGCKENNDLDNVFNKYFDSCIGHKVEFKHLIDTLLSPPYGMRRGVLPLLIAHEISKRNGTPVLYLKDKEILINDESIANIVRKPQDYSLFIEEASAVKDKYIENVENLFAEYSVYCKDVDSKNRMSKAVCLMQTWYRSLPQSSVSFMLPDNDKQDINKIIAFRNIFKDYYLNPRDVLFESIPDALETETFDETYEEIKKIKAEINNHIVLLKASIIEKMRQIFGFSAGTDITKSLEDWYSHLPEDTRKCVFGGSAGDVISLFKEPLPSDPEFVASLFAKAVTGVYIEDWSEKSIIKFQEYLEEILSEIVNRGEKSVGNKRLSIVSENGEMKDCLIDYNPNDISVSGTFLKNALSDVLEEYGDVIDDNEKLGIIMELASKLIK